MDMFGERVQFTFRKESSFKTHIGAFVSCVMSVFFIIFFSLRSIKLVTKDDPFFSLTMMGADDVSIDIWELDFMFAIENLDPRIGRVIVTQTTWDFRDGDTKKEKQNIEMVDCREYQEGGEYENFDLRHKKTLIDNINMTRKTDSTFLCPYLPNDSSMTIQGHFGSEYFQYVKLKIEGCDLGNECFTDEELYEKTVNFISLRSHPNLLGEELDEVVSFQNDFTYFKFIDPEVTQSTNMYFSKNLMSLNDNMFDVFEIDEKTVELYEVIGR